MNRPNARQWLLLSLLSLCAVARAEPDQGRPLWVGLQAGGILDPFRRPLAFGVQGGWRFSPELSLSMGLWSSPPLDLLPNRPLMTQMDEDLSTVRFTTRVSLAADLGLQVILARGTLDAAGGAPVEVLLGLGAGVVRTVDDLEAMGVPDHPDGLPTQVELHHSLDLRASARVQPGDRLLLGLEVRRFTFQEVYFISHPLRTTRSAITLVVGTTLGRAR